MALHRCIIPSNRSFSACTLRPSPDRVVVVYNPRSGEPRRRSDIAHELAHALLDHELSRVERIGDVTFLSGDATQEDEAAWLSITSTKNRPGVVYAGISQDRSKLTGRPWRGRLRGKGYSPSQSSNMVLPTVNLGPAQLHCEPQRHRPWGRREQSTPGRVRPRPYSRENLHLEVRAGALAPPQRHVLFVDIVVRPDMSWLWWDRMSC